MNGMREFVSGLVSWVHPGMGSLLRRADGQRSPGVERHLRRCAGCRRQTALIEEAAVRRPAGEPVLEKLFESIDLRIDAWCSLAGVDRGRDAADARIIDSALTRTLEMYFGSGTARRIQSCGRGDISGRRLVPVATPLFASFLGQKAAESLASRIVRAT